jgi:hypothetical protein
MKIILVLLISAMLVLGGLGFVFGSESDTANVVASVTVLGTISITAENMAFGSVDVNTTKNTNLSLTIDSNAPYKVETRADAGVFSAGEGKEFSVANLKAGTLVYNTTSQQLLVGDIPGSTHIVEHSLTIPENTKAGTYTVGITLTATQI